LAVWLDRVVSRVRQTLTGICANSEPRFSA
jgi:hypothetical protein